MYILSTVMSSLIVVSMRGVVSGFAMAHRRRRSSYPGRGWGNVYSVLSSGTSVKYLCKSSYPD